MTPYVRRSVSGWVGRPESSTSMLLSLRDSLVLLLNILRTDGHRDGKSRLQRTLWPQNLLYKRKTASLQIILSVHTSYVRLMRQLAL